MRSPPASLSSALCSLGGPIARSLLLAPLGSVELALQDALHRIAEVLDARQVTWWSVDHDEGFCEAVADWRSDGGPSLRGGRYYRDEFPITFDNVVAGATLQVHPNDDMSAFPGLVDVLRAEGLVRYMLVADAPSAPVRGGLSVRIATTDKPPLDDDGLRALRCLASTLAAATERVHRLQRESELERQLREVQRIDSLGVLAGGVAHDFGNQLQAIAGAVHLLRAPGGERTEQYLDMLEEAVRRSSDLTHRLLVFGRHETGPPRSERVAPAVEAAVALGTRITSARTPVHLRQDDHLGSVRVPRADLELALVNLIRNAADAMPDGGAVHVDATRHDGRMVLTVTDHGAGMSPEQLARATDPFFTTKAIGRGTGLGLAMVQAMVDKAGGQLELHSALGLGTRVRMVLPACDEQALPLDEAVEMHAGEGTVLVVEDDPIVRRVACTVLRRAGFDPVSTAHGAEALDVLAWRDVDLVVADVVMPRMGGVELFHRVQDDRPLPFLFTTGYSPRAIALPDDALYDVLLKPYPPPQLLARVGALLARA